jgi:translation elongation factor EF-Tu-like GTPase
MTVADVFTFPGRGIVVTGRIESGRVRAFTEIDIEGPSSAGKAIVTDVTVPGKRVEVAQAGDVVSLLLRGLPGSGKREILPGDVLLRGSRSKEADGPR